MVVTRRNTNSYFQKLISIITLQCYIDRDFAKEMDLRYFKTSNGCHESFKIRQASSSESFVETVQILQILSKIGLAMSILMSPIGDHKEHLLN